MLAPPASSARHDAVAHKRRLQLPNQELPFHTLQPILIRLVPLRRVTAPQGGSRPLPNRSGVFCNAIVIFFFLSLGIHMLNFKCFETSSWRMIFLFLLFSQVDKSVNLGSELSFSTLKQHMSISNIQLTDVLWRECAASSHQQEPCSSLRSQVYMSCSATPCLPCEKC